MKKILLLIAIISIIPSVGSAQWRMDCAIRLGRDDVKHYEDPITTGWGSCLGYSEGFGWGADMNIGYEFKYGLGLYSGVAYDNFRIRGGKVGHVNVHGDYIDWERESHPFGFATVPLKLEYRFAHDIIRPYIGYGAAILLYYKHDNYTATHIAGELQYHRVTPTFLYGINLEYKKFILGAEVRRDQKKFLEEHINYDFSCRAYSFTFRVGYRIF